MRWSRDGSTPPRRRGGSSTSASRTRPLLLERRAPRDERGAAVGDLVAVLEQAHRAAPLARGERGGGEPAREADEHARREALAEVLVLVEAAAAEAAAPAERQVLDLGLRAVHELGARAPDAPPDEERPNGVRVGARAGTEGDLLALGRGARVALAGLGRGSEGGRRDEERGAGGEDHGADHPAILSHFFPVQGGSRD